MTALNIFRLAIKIQNKAGISVTDIILVGGYWWVEACTNNYWIKASELLGGKHERLGKH